MDTAGSTATTNRIEDDRLASHPRVLRQSSPPVVDMTDHPFRERYAIDAEPRPLKQEVQRDLRWLVRLRWLAIVSILAAILFARQVEWIEHLTVPLIGVAALLVFNFWCYATTCRHMNRGQDARRLLWTLFLQLEVDLLALTFLVHATGGVENPFVLMYVFPVALAAILLPRRMAMLICGSAILLYLAMIAGELVESRSHRPFPGHLDELASGNNDYRMLGSHTYILALASAMTLTLSGIVYFLQSLTRARRRSEHRRRQHELIARSRERMARVGTVAAGLAHTIRNPLHGLLNCVELLDGSLQDKEGAATLDLMREGLTRIEGVTTRLLTLTREAPISPEMEDLNTQVLDTVHSFELRCRGQDTHVHKKLDPFLPQLPLDADRFHEALFNIIDNAHDAIIEGPGEVVVQTYRIHEPFEGAAVDVRDNGEGISEEDLENIFNPFFTTKPIGEGTGLGLGIARRVIEEHGGILSVTSERGLGTTMTILLPLEADPSDLLEEVE